MKKLYFFKQTIFGVFLMLACTGSIAQITVTYTQQTGQYDQSSPASGGGIFNNGGGEVGMWMNGDNTATGNVLWKTFRVGSSTGSAVRNLQIGDEFTITVATKGFYYGTIGVSLNSGSIPSASWANRHANSRIRIQQDGSNFGGGNPGSWYYSNGSSTSFGITPTGSYVDYVIKVKLTSTDRCNVSVNATTFYDVALGGSAGAAITHFSIYMSDDRAGVWTSPNRGDSYWKQATTVQNTGLLNVGESNSSYTVSTVVANGLDANSTSSNALNNTLRKRGTGNLTLNAANTYAGETQLDNGELWIESSGSIAMGSGIYVGNGGQLGNDTKLWLANSAGGTTFPNNITINNGNAERRWLGGLNSSGTHTFSGNITNNSTNGLYLRTVSAGGNTVFSGVISGSNPVITRGAGTVTLAGSSANTYTGTTTAEGPLVLNKSAGLRAVGNALVIATGVTVRADAANQFGTSGPALTTINGTGVFNGNANSQVMALASASSTSSVTMGAGTLTIQNAGNDTYAGTISGTGGLVKTGTGTWTISGSNTWTGGVTLTNGTLQLGAANVIASGNKLVMNGGTFRTGSATGFGNTLNTLELLENSAIILGTGNHTLSFANSSGETWTSGKILAITGWTGTAGSSGTAGKIFFGSNNSSLTSGQLDQITLNGAPVMLLGTGELVPLPVYITNASGNWDNGPTWVGGSVPPAGALITIAHAVTLNQAATVSNITINNGASLAGSDATPRTLTISAGGVFQNNGSFNGGTGTVLLQGAATISGSAAASFNNLVLTTGTLTLNTAPVINGTFTINGGSVNVPGSAYPTYASNSNLVYASGGAFGRTGEWSSAAATSPGNVIVRNGTTLNIGGPSNDLGIVNDLLLGEAGSTGSLNMQSSGQAINVGRHVTINGTAGSSTLTLSTAAGGDMRVAGNWQRTGSGAFTPNNRAVFFNGSGLQTIERVGGSGAETFSFFRDSKSAGDVRLLSNVVINTSTAGDVLSLLGPGNFDLNGNTLTFSGNGGNILVGGTAGSTVRTIAGPGNVIYNGTKGIANNNGRSLTFGNNVVVTLNADDVSFGSGLATIQHRLVITGGWVASGGAPYYATGSELVYDHTRTIGEEWYPGTFGNVTGVPKKVVINASRTVSFGNVTTEREVYGDIEISGTLVLATAGTGGRLKVSGNWLRNSGGTFTPQGRVVEFNGSGGAHTTQTITAPGTETFSRLAVNKGTGQLQLTGNVQLTSTDDILQLLNVGSLNLNGNTLTLSGSGGNVVVGGTNPAGSAARNITGPGTVAYTGTKLLTANDSKTLTFGNNVTVTISAPNCGFSNGAATVQHELIFSGSGSLVGLGEAPYYGSNSTLIFDRNMTVLGEWYENNVGDVTGVPKHVKVNAGRNVAMNSGSFIREMAGNLTLDGTLTFSGVSGGDVNVKGNITVNTGGTLNTNGRLLRLNGTGAQTLSGTTAGTVSVNFLQVNSAGVVTFNLPVNVVNNITVNNAGPSLLVNENLTVVNGGTFNRPVTVASDKTLALTGGTLTTNNHLTLNSGASLLHGTGTPGGGGAITGDVTVRRTGSTGSRYNFWSAPVWGAPVNVIGGPVNRRYYYSPVHGTLSTADDDNDPGWKPATGTANVGQGYASLGGGTVTFAGPVNNGPKDYTVTAALAPNSPFNLVGNPYPSALSASDFMLANGPLGSGVLSGSIYFWDDPSTGGGYTGADYAVWNSLGSTSGGGGKTPSGNIGSGQGFFVQASNSGDITFTNAMRNAGNIQFFEEPETSGRPVQRVRLSVMNQQGDYNETLIGFTDNATEGNDPLYDAAKLRGNMRLALFSLLGEAPMAIQGLPPLTSDRVVAIGMDASLRENHTLSLKELENIPATVMIYLEDKETGSYINFRKEESYTFTKGDMMLDQRFFLHFTAPATISATTETCTRNDGMLSIETPSEVNVEVRVVSPEGSVVMTETEGSGRTLEGLSPGAYRILFTFEDGYVAEEVAVVGRLDAADLELGIAELPVEVTVLEPAVFSASANGLITWNMGDGSVYTASDVTHMYREPGIYSVSVVVDNGSCKTSETFSVAVRSDDVTGISSLTGDAVFSLSPNPATDMVTINASNLKKGTYRLQVTDLTGRVVSDEQLTVAPGNALRVPVSSFEEGLYLVVLSGNGVQVASRLEIMR